MRLAVGARGQMRGQALLGTVMGAVRLCGLKEGLPRDGNQSPKEWLGGASRYLLVFPSIEGCMYLLKKKGCMTTDETAYDEEDDEF